MTLFQQQYEEWMHANITEEKNQRRLELLEKGLGHGTVELLRSIWLPAAGNFNHLYPEWEVRDLNNGYRYLDLAYLPNEIKGDIEIHGFGSHARDLDVRRFKDLCWRQSLLALDGWISLPIAYLSIVEEPKKCQQLVLSFIGKFMSTAAPPQLSWLEAEVVRFARRMLRPITPMELATHLRISDRHIRRILSKLRELNILMVASGDKRARTYTLRL